MKRDGKLRPESTENAKLWALRETVAGWRNKCRDEGSLRSADNYQYVVDEIDELLAKRLDELQGEQP